MRSIILFAVLLLLAPLVVTAQAKTARSKYVGYQYKGVTPESTLPNGVKHFGGGLIGNVDADPVYGISQVKLGKTTMLWLEVSTGRDSSGITGWLVKDVLSFPALTASDYVFFAGDPAAECKRAGQPIEELVGVGKIFRKLGIFRPSKLWVPNLKTEKFESIKVAGVTCTYSEP